MDSLTFYYGIDEELIFTRKFLTIDLEKKTIVNGLVGNPLLSYTTLVINHKESYEHEDMIPYLKSHYPYEEVDNLLYVVLFAVGCSKIDAYFDIIKIDDNKNKDVIIFDKIFIFNENSYNWGTIFYYCKKILVEMDELGFLHELDLFSVDVDTCEILIPTSSGSYLLKPKGIKKLADGIFYLHGSIILTTDSAKAKAKLIGFSKLRKVYGVED